MTHGSYRTGFLGLMIVLGLLLPGVAQARGPEYLDIYKEGLDAVERENWPRAAERMKQAIQGRHSEARRLGQYFWIKPYIPHFYLGLAMFKQDDCAAALAAWDETERQGIIQQRPEYEQIGLARELCASQNQSTKPRRGERAAASQTPPPPTSPPPQTAAPTPPAPSPPKARPKPTRQASAEPPRSARDPGRDADVPSVSISQMTIVTGPKGEPHPDLLDAAGAFLGGAWKQVIERLQAFDTDDPYANAHASLLRAAAELSLYLEGGELERDRLEEARHHVLATRRTLPDLEPPERYFSPRFLDFYYGQRLEEDS